MFPLTQTFILICDFMIKKNHQCQRERQLASTNQSSRHRPYFFCHLCTMKEASPTRKKVIVPHMGMLRNFPVKYLRQRAMVGAAKGGTQTRMIREGNETMRYNIVCWTLCELSQPCCHVGVFAKGVINSKAAASFQSSNFQ